MRNILTLQETSQKEVWKPWTWTFYINIDINLPMHSQYSLSVDWGSEFVPNTKKKHLEFAGFQSFPAYERGLLEIQGRQLQFSNFCQKILILILFISLFLEIHHSCHHYQSHPFQPFIFCMWLLGPVDCHSQDTNTGLIHGF